MKSICQRSSRSSLENHGGKPCIRHMRIAVAYVLAWMGSGMSVEQILGDFPELTEADLRDCLLFAANRERQTLYAA